MAEIKIKQIRLFIASSMKTSVRKEVCAIIHKVNEELKIIGERYGNRKEYKVVMFNEEFVDCKSDTQVQLNEAAALCDLFILLADNNTSIGDYTILEYKTAQEQADIAANNKPDIKVIVIKEEKEESIRIEYTDGGIKCDFEDRLENSGRYILALEKNTFDEKFSIWLKRKALYPDEDNVYTQEELSYKSHLANIGQFSIRQSENKYYRRDRLGDEIDGLDDEIERVLDSSPILILEGNTYSGKTRAAYEVMKSFEKWKDYSFHIYDSRNKLSDLNNIRINFQGKNVYFIDDINDIIEKKGENEFIEINESDLWSKLNEPDCFASLSKMGETRVIITVSGKLTEREKKDYYGRIFNDSSDEFYNKLRAKVIVNFDIYDRQKFRQMVDNMVRDGFLSTKDVTPGNYTIGSLFIKDAEIRKLAEDSLKQDKYLLQAIVGQYKYSKYSQYTGLITEIKDLYTFLRWEMLYEEVEKKLEYEPVFGKFNSQLEELRKNGLIFIKKYQVEEQNQIFYDKQIIDIFSSVVTSTLSEKELSLNRNLINYAYKIQEHKGSINCNVSSVARMGYLLCDRNTLPDDEIKDIIRYISEKRGIIINYKNYIPHMVKLCKSDSQDSVDSIHFCETAIASLQDFNLANEMILDCSKLRYLKDERTRNLAIKLYKHVIYAMFSMGNRRMTMAQENIILGYIFNDEDEDKPWKEPFSIEDLKSVFNLARISPFIGKLTPKDIITLAADAIDATLGENKYIEDVICALYDGSNPPSDDRGENIYLRKVSETLMSAICKVADYDEFLELIKFLSEQCKSSNNLKKSVGHKFAKIFYKGVESVADQFSYEERFKFFDFLLSIDDGKGIIDIGDSFVKDEVLKSYHIEALNKMLELLDEIDSLKAYELMLSKGLYDMRSFSCLLRNEFLRFEHLLPYISKKGEHKNFITLNQMMKKAETVSDAHLCMCEMGITDGKPCRDENALSQYINVKGINRTRTIQILKDWHNEYQNKILSDKALNVILQKFSIENLFDIIYEKIKDKDYYLQNYGLRIEEVENIRRNAMLISILFFKVNNSKNQEHIFKIKKLFSAMLESDELRKLIIDPQYNGNNSILSLYIKNSAIFTSFENMKQFADDLCENYKSFIRKDHHIYQPYIYWIVENMKRGVYDRRTALEQVNGILKEAYNYFAEYNQRKEVVRMMTPLYHYVPQLICENDYNECLDFVYEDKDLKNITFQEYIEYFIYNNPSYVDGTFIYNTLSIMQNSVDEGIYELLGSISQHNRNGVKYDTVFKLPNVVSERLIATRNGKIEIDDRFICNVSIIKLLWYMLSNNKVTLEEAETYRKQNRIAVTQTYANVACKAMQKMILKEYYRRKCDVSVLEDGFKKMNDYINQETSNLIHKSIEMCLSLIAVAPNKDELDKIFLQEGFKEFRRKPEIIVECMDRIYKFGGEKNQMLDDLKTEISEENKDGVNIAVINTYLWVNYLSDDKDHIKFKFIYERCWDTLISENKVDVNKLLNRDDIDSEWKIEANAQTFIYFANQCPRLFSVIKEKFDRDYTYDDKKKKSCLKSAIKNYSYAYKKWDYPYELQEIADELQEIALLLSLQENIGISTELSREYVLKSIKNNGTWRAIGHMWKDMLNLYTFKNNIAQQMCAYAEAIDKNSSEVLLNLEDINRIDVLSEALNPQSLNSFTNEKINKTYENIKTKKALDIMNKIFGYKQVVLRS